MKVTVTQENFAKALNYVSKAISSNPSIPVLSNVLIEVENKQLKLSTTDLELGISTVIGADAKTEGKTTVNAKTLSEFVNSLTSGTLDLALSDKVMTVKNKQNSADFNIVSAEEFPPLPQADEKAEFKVSSLDFAKAINKVAFSTASDDSRPVLTGILFEATTKRLTMVGVDGFRLSKKVMDVKRAAKSDLSQIVPARALSEVARIAQDAEDEKASIEVYLLSDKNQMLFEVDDVEVSTRLIEGEFPEYQQILPKESKFKFKVEKEALAQTIKVVNIFARSAIGNKAVFEFKPSENELKLSAQVADVGENESTVEVHDVEGDDLKTGFNVGFLNEMLTAFEGEEIEFESNGVTAPGVFKDSEDKDYLHIIMPMRLD
jgi:DNA polymerase-3 subunit beta